MLEQENDALLVQQAKDGDMAAFERLIIQYEKMVYNIALKMMSNQEDAKDVSQDVFIKLFRNLDKFKGDSSFSTWTYRIAVNTCIDELRKRKKKMTVSIDMETEGEDSKIKRELTDNAPTPEESYLEKEGTEKIRAAMEQLSNDHKMMITLRDFQGLSYTEIAEITELSLGTVKSRIARARLQLKNLLLVNGELNLSLYRQNLQERRVKNEL